MNFACLPSAYRSAVGESVVDDNAKPFDDDVDNGSPPSLSESENSDEDDDEDEEEGEQLRTAAKNGNIERVCKSLRLGVRTFIT